MAVLPPPVTPSSRSGVGSPRGDRSRGSTRRPVPGGRSGRCRRDDHLEGPGGAWPAVGADAPGSTPRAAPDGRAPPAPRRRDAPRRARRGRRPRGSCRHRSASPGPTSPGAAAGSSSSSARAATWRGPRRGPGDSPPAARVAAAAAPARVSRLRRSYRGPGAAVTNVGVSSSGPRLRARGGAATACRALPGWRGRAPAVAARRARRADRRPPRRDPPGTRGRPRPRA